MAARLISFLASFMLLVASSATASDRPPAPTPPEHLDGAELAKWLRDNGCPGCTVGSRNLAGADLRGVDLTGATLADLDLRGAKMSGARLDGAAIQGQLDGVDLSGASMRGVTLGCSPFFVGGACTSGGVADDQAVQLAGADLRGADVSGVPPLRLAGAKVEGALLYVGFPPSLVEAEFESVRLGGTYGSSTDPQSFTKAEIGLLSHHVGFSDGAWATYTWTLPGSQLAPSYDCARAGNDAERAVCSDPQLAALDRLLSGAYAAAKKAVGKDAVRGPQRTFLTKRNACGGDSGCIASALRGRVSALLAQAGAGAAAPGLYRPLYSLPPGLTADLVGTEAGARLQRLLTTDSDWIRLTPRPDGTLGVEAAGLGGNGHTCGIEEGSARYDAGSGRYLLGDGVVADEGAITAAGDALIFEGGMWWCGARASLVGTYIKVE